ncbi:MAG: hypothetical protein AB7L13_06990 [Acidimicrobiia bacterium]
MTDDASDDKNPDGLQALLLAGIAGLRTVLDLAERAARDPQGAAQVVNSLAAFAKLAFEQVGSPSAPPADAESGQGTQATNSTTDDGQGGGD